MNESSTGVAESIFGGAVGLVILAAGAALTLVWLIFPFIVWHYLGCIREYTRVTAWHTEQMHKKVGDELDARRPAAHGRVEEQR